MPSKKRSSYSPPTTCQALNEVGISGLQLGAGTFFVTFESLHAHFAPFGWNLDQFLDFLRAIACPPIVSPTGQRLVHYFKFVMALETITTLGQSEFWDPAYTAGAGRKDPSPYPHTSRLNPEVPALAWERILGTLLFARKNVDLSNPPEVRETMSSALRLLAAQAARVLDTKLVMQTRDVSRHYCDPTPHTSAIDDDPNPGYSTLLSTSPAFRARLIPLESPTCSTTSPSTPSETPPPSPPTSPPSPPPTSTPT